MIFLDNKCPRKRESNPIIKDNIEFKKNSLYAPLPMNWNNWKDQPLNVVRDPKKPNPKHGYCKNQVKLTEKKPKTIPPNIWFSGWVNPVSKKNRGYSNATHPPPIK